MRHSCFAPFSARGISGAILASPHSLQEVLLWRQYCFSLFSVRGTSGARCFSGGILFKMNQLPIFFFLPLAARGISSVEQLLKQFSVIGINCKILLSTFVCKTVFV